MKQNWQKGWPKGTRVKFVGESVQDHLRGKEATVYKELYFDDETDTMAYHVYHNGQKYNTPAGWLEFVSFSVPMQNWARQKVELLKIVSPSIAYQLGYEQQFGDFPDYGGCCGDKHGQ